MKKSAAKEPLLNTLARQVGHAAGTIAKAAQNLASDAVAVVKTDAAKPTAPRTKAAKKTMLAKQVLQELNAGGHKLDTLSMGMSGDFESAIAEGATLVRIGTALFGNRQAAG